MEDNEMNEIFNIVCGFCSIAGLAVSLFTASRVYKISKNIYINERTKRGNKISIKGSTVGQDLIGGDKFDGK